MQQGDGDIVTARALPGKPGQVVIESIDGDNGRLSLDPAKNCIGIAATETLKLIGQPSCGVALKLKKVGARLPLHGCMHVLRCIAGCAMHAGMQCWGQHSTAVCSPLQHMCTTSVAPGVKAGAQSWAAKPARAWQLQLSSGGAGGAGSAAADSDHAWLSSALVPQPHPLCRAPSLVPHPTPCAQGLPLGSGMGSSAASAAAAAWAVNGVFGSPVSKDRLVLAGLASEAAVSGYHADNIAPAILGGFVLVR